jgi:hypothetical protein
VGYASALLVSEIEVIDLFIKIPFFGWSTLFKLALDSYFSISYVFFIG